MARTKLKAGKRFREWLAEEMRDPEFKEHYERASIELMVADKVAAARRAQNVTQNELARRLHTKQQAVSRIESGGQNTTVEILDKIAKALGLSLEVNFRPGRHR